MLTQFTQFERAAGRAIELSATNVGVRGQYSKALLQVGGIFFSSTGNQIKKKQENENDHDDREDSLNQSPDLEEGALIYPPEVCSSACSFGRPRASTEPRHEATMSTIAIDQRATPDDD